MDIQLYKLVFIILLGLGEKNLKNLKKPEIGHYLKNDISPKY